MSKTFETRIATVGLERREEGDRPTIRGYAAVFDSPADIAGMFREQVSPGAFKRAIKEDDVRALVDHDASMVLGRSKSGTLRLKEDKRGLAVEIDPPDTQTARDIMTLMERGDVNQMSFAFLADEEAWEENKDDLPLRTLRSVQLFDVSIVTYPAYPDTEVGLRSLERKLGASDRASAEAIQRRMRMRQRQLEAFRTR